MDTLTVVFTKRKWNLISWLIRWMLPRSQFYLALSSHCQIVDGDHRIEAHMLYGVRRVPADVAMEGVEPVRTVHYTVPSEEDGLAWARDQVKKKYDWLGAFGLGLAVDRDWQKPDAWFCYELAASAIVHAGRDCFADTGHITESALLSMKP
jgi:hypothetical protein